MTKYTEIKELQGKVLKSISNTGNELEMILEDGTKVVFFHSQDCCEHVYIESITGDLQDLVGSPILLAEEASENDPEADESGTWTFYKFATIKGYVDVRWHGSSNGYYSESVSWCILEPGKEEPFEYRYR